MLGARGRWRGGGKVPGVGWWVLPAGPRASGHPGREAAAASAASSISGGGGSMVGGGRRAGGGAVMWHSGRGAKAAGLPPPRSASAESGYSAAQTLRGGMPAGGTESCSPLPAQGPPPGPGAPPPRGRLPFSHLRAWELTSKPPADPA